MLMLFYEKHVPNRRMCVRESCMVEGTVLNFAVPLRWIGLKTLEPINLNQVAAQVATIQDVSDHTYYSGIGLQK